MMVLITYDVETSTEGGAEAFEESSQGLYGLRNEGSEFGI